MKNSHYGCYLRHLNLQDSIVRKISRFLRHKDDMGLGRARWVIGRAVVIARVSRRVGLLKEQVCPSERYVRTGALLGEPQAGNGTLRDAERRRNLIYYVHILKLTRQISKAYKFIIALHDVVLEPGDFRRGDTHVNGALNGERRARLEGVVVVVELDRLDERRDATCGDGHAGQQRGKQAERSEELHGCRTVYSVVVSVIFWRVETKPPGDRVELSTS